MKAFLMLFGVPAAAILIFFSGSLPYTLIYDEESLMDLEFEGKEPVSAEVKKCEIQNTDDMRLGEVLDASFRATLENHTDRFVVVSAMGEIFSPKGHSTGINSQLMILNPNSIEETHFRTNAAYTSPGRYRCEMRYAIGRFN